MNDYYLKNMSDKIKAAMTAMAKDGQYVSGKDPCPKQGGFRKGSKGTATNYRGDRRANGKAVRKQA